jgi:hypothetical protein
MKRKILVLLVIVTTLANFIFADIAVSGPELSTPLEIYSIWNPSSEPLFILSASSQSIDYSQSSIQFETEDYDLSYSNQTDNFTLYVYSNYSKTYKGDLVEYREYSLDIYFSEYFVPVDDTEYNAGNFPEVDIYLNKTLNQDTVTFHEEKNNGNGYINRTTTDNYISESSWYQGYSTSMDYGSRNVDAYLYRYDIIIPSGLHSLDLIYFNFGWDGYTDTVDQYWDMEAYVRIDITSNS